MAAPRATTTVFTVRGPIARSDLPGLCSRVCRLLERSGADVALCDVDRLVEPDAVAIDALARLQLSARRIGCRIRLRHGSDELHELLAFVGLNSVVPTCGLRLEPGGQAEEREQLLGAEEERELGDPAR
jgi:ABC-type transporter Mla MlaB component